MYLPAPLNEYLLVIEIPKPATEKIEKVRSEMLGNYAITQPKTGKPTIVLARFVLPEYTETQVKYALHPLLTKENSFTLHLKNFKGYPMHCMYIPIENQWLLLQLTDKIKTIRNQLKTKGENPYFLQDPVIPLVAKIDKDIYLRVYKAYEQKTFLESFSVNRILLLKRANPAQKFSIIHSFALNQAAVLRNLQFV
jgi:2'-5' RNA ligase